ncbi:MAG TPA: ECF-type sigma factor [Phycisphaerales bacterium]|nr:ECF-type sigma factor [Phycisphaerales bacterium]
MASVPADITRVLESASQGDAAAKSQLFDAVYDELRSMAAALLAHERPDAKVTIQPTSLVHEAYLKLIRNAEPAWQSRAHFFGAAARAMRQILIDRARHLKAIRGRAAELHEDTGLPTLDSAASPARAVDDLLALDTAMDSLRNRDERQHDVVMLRFFAGLNVEQTAAALGVSATTVKNEWSFARAWLMREIDRSRLS